jgi:hypothetical protein
MTPRKFNIVIVVLTTIPACSNWNTETFGNHQSNDYISLHNHIRQALNKGKTLNNLSNEHNMALDRQYDFGQQPTPNPPLALLKKDTRLVASASAYVEQCVFAHSPRAGQDYGENILFSANEGQSIRNAINSWAYEAKDYNYATNTCRLGAKFGCAHYTQLVARRSTHVGCAEKRCQPLRNKNGKVIAAWANLYVCHYSPQGNIIGRKPY